MSAPDPFLPDWASPPGETIADILAERQVSVADLAERLGEPATFVHDLLVGKAHITNDVAEGLARALGPSAAFWRVREEQYRSDLERQRQAETAAETQRWLQTLPIKNMVRFGWMPKSALSNPLNAVRQFFDVSDVSEWHQTYGNALQAAAFRTSAAFAANAGSVAAWLRKGEIDARAIRCAPWDAAKFKSLLPELRGLTRRKAPAHFVDELKTRCAACGVAVVIARAPSGCRASGATKFLSPTKAMLLLSFRYLSDDQFWFSFFHEAGHLLLHGQHAVFLEGEGALSTREEAEANEFAANVLVPARFRDELQRVPLRAKDLIRLAVRVGVSPGVIVGQLHHLDRIPQDRFHRLRRKYKWA